MDSSQWDLFTRPTEPRLHAVQSVTGIDNQIVGGRFRKQYCHVVPHRGERVSRFGFRHITFSLGCSHTRILPVGNTGSKTGTIDTPERPSKH